MANGPFPLRESCVERGTGVLSKILLADFGARSLLFDPSWEPLPLVLLPASNGRTLENECDAARPGKGASGGLDMVVNGKYCYSVMNSVQ